MAKKDRNEGVEQGSELAEFKAKVHTLATSLQQAINDGRSDKIVGLTEELAALSAGGEQEAPAVEE